MISVVAVSLKKKTRYRESLIRTRAAIANRIQKVIESGNIKLGQVASDVLGASGKAMLQKLAAGEKDPVVISELARGSLRKKMGELKLALQGELNEAQRFVLGELLQRL